MLASGTSVASSKADGTTKEMDLDDPVPRAPVTSTASGHNADSQPDRECARQDAQRIAPRHPLELGPAAWRLRRFSASPRKLAASFRFSICRLLELSVGHCT